MRSNPTISIEELAELCGLTRDGINYNIRNLKNKGIIKRIGPDKGGHWEVIENLNEIEDEGEIYETIEDVWPDYPTKEDFLFNEDEY